jgi:prepilin-type N-terminal cleavage/methylation domain-containing protein
MKSQGFSLVEAMIALGVLGVVAGATGALTLQTQKSVRAAQVSANWTMAGNHAMGLLSSGTSCTTWITNPDFFPQQLPIPLPSASEPKQFSAIGAGDLILARAGQTSDGIQTLSLEYWRAMDLTDGHVTLALRWRAKKESALGAELPGVSTLERTFLIRASISPTGEPFSCEGLSNIESCASVGGVYNASAEPPCQLPQLTVASSAAAHEAG